MGNYNTNLASEFFVMSMLYRKGLDAYLTLGNKKSVDILVKKVDGSTLKSEVKGVNKKSDDWPLSSGELKASEDLNFVLISYESKIHDLSTHPKVWIIPSALIIEKYKQSPTKIGKTPFKCLSHKLVREEFLEYQDNWQPLEG